MLTEQRLETLKQIGKALAGQFGKNCEIVIHKIAPDHSGSEIVFIENGEISGRKLGDGPSHVVLKQLAGAEESGADHVGYLTRSPDGKLLKSSTVFIRDEEGKVCAIFSINYDISLLSAARDALGGLILPLDADGAEPERIPQNVTELLDDLIRQADRLIGKPPTLMSKEEKIRAIRFLDANGALLITRSGDKISKHFQISKYTLYSYLESGKQEEKPE